MASNQFVLFVIFSIQFIASIGSVAQELIGRGKSHQVQAARRELVFELITKDFEVTDIAEFLSNRALSIIRRLDESYLSREDNKRRER